MAPPPFFRGFWGLFIQDWHHRSLKMAIHFEGSPHLKRQARLLIERDLWFSLWKVARRMKPTDFALFRHFGNLERCVVNIIFHTLLRRKLALLWLKHNLMQFTAGHLHWACTLFLEIFCCHNHCCVHFLVCLETELILWETPISKIYPSPEINGSSCRRKSRDQLK